MSDELVLGIDLGTTFSAMAIVDRFGKPVIVPNADGHPTTPSVVHFYHRDACVVGEEAVKMVVVDPTNVVRFVKRSMGEPDFTLEFFGRSYTPQELSAIILRKMKEDAEEALGRAVRDAVITVPAYFNSAQRGATAEAGVLAGLNVLSIINEPTTAAIAYGVENLGHDRRLLVFDLGGGTFDVTLMEIAGVSFRTIASDGNAELGGKDWDDRLVNHVAEQFVERFEVDPRDDPHRYQELYERCLHAKLSLSSRPRAVIPVTYRGHRLVVSVTREEFEGMTRDLVDQCADTCSLVMERSGASWDDLDEVLLVGGSTRMPMIRDRLAALSGSTPNATVNPDECVALGAALAGVLRHRPDHPALLTHRQALARRSKAASDGAPAAPVAAPAAELPRNTGSEPPLSGGQTDPGALGGLPGLPQVEVTDVTTHPLGVIVLDRNLEERVITLIPSATSVPVEKRGRFAYAYDNMTAVRVEITEGEGQSRDEVKVIGEVILDNLPPRPRGTVIDVIYRYGVNQILEVDVIDVETRATRRARINLKGGLSEQGLSRAQDNVRRAHVS
ncbi:MAG: Hsp70 family protein [Alphaproteobacteria bacterium]|nr:Hsp70 family protein [Alphaproteobacteria bacterium]